jgi:hypothetical protein
MARKQDKLRPYRVDYFNIDEMKDNDMALVRSVTVRAVTSAEAATKVLDDNAALPIVLIRSYRYYKQITHKKDVFKPVEDLFSEKNALIVMGEVEKYRAEQTPVVADHATPDPAFGVDKATFYKTNAGTQVQSQAPAVAAVPDELGHVTRFSDSSLYDEVCVHCGATDTSGKLEDVCPKSVAPTSGPDSPATVAVVADMNGMLAHDEHEQVMDTFVPTPGQPDISKYEDKTALPPDHPDHVCTDACYEIVPLSDYHEVFPEPAAINDPMPGTPSINPFVVTGDEPLSLKLKVLAFAVITIVVLGALIHFLHQ